MRNYSPTRRRIPTAPQFEDVEQDGPDFRKSDVAKLEQQVASNVRGIQRLKSEIWQLEREKRKEQRKDGGKGKKRVRWESADRSESGSFP